MNIVNELVGPEVFNELDRQMRANIERHHGKGFWIWQGTAWTAVAVLALVMLFWEGDMKSARLPPLSPLHALDIRMERSARDQFVSQMWAFGEAFGFRMLVKNYRAKPDDMFFQMWHPDVDLLAANDSDTGATDLKIGIGFYPKRGQPPPSPENVAPLVEGLRQFLDKVPGAAIQERAPRR